MRQSIICGKKTKKNKTSWSRQAKKKQKTFAHIKLLVFKAVAGVAVSSVGGIIHPGSAQKYAYHLFHFIPAPPLMFNVSVLMASPCRAQHNGRCQTSAKSMEDGDLGHVNGPQNWVGGLEWPLTDGLFHLLNAIIFKLKALSTQPPKVAPDRSRCLLNVGATFAGTFAIYLNPAASEVKCDSL